MAKKLTTEDFILKAKEIHGDKYDYSKANYVSSNTKVIIICPIHGEFEQTPSKHINLKHGCPKCGQLKQVQKRTNTTEFFIKKAKEIHGNKFDYSKVEYINNRTKVCVICPIHGEFWITPTAFLSSKHGCQLCSNWHKNNTEEFISKAKNVHGDKYDYSKVEYIDVKTKVCIVCPIHGEFYQTPNAHLKGKGCPHCGNIFKGKKFKLTTEQFISKARKIHGNKYDYSKVDYINNTTKVCIICPIHGEFWQRPVDHYKNRGCKLCDKEKIKLSTEEFIEKARKIHGDKYDYSKVNYVNCKTKVTIICPIHGEFKQTPSGHLEGKGCYNCFKYKKLTTEEFIEKAKLIHGNKYDYSKVNYVNCKTKVCIICPIHGEFWQNTSSHLKGCGCKSCHFSVLEKNIKHFLIDNNIEFEIQKKFDWLGKQSLDFYLPLYNIAIECQGMQHFKKNKFFGGEDAYIDRIKRDKRKYNLCKENKIKLLYFTNVNENLIPKIYFDTIYSNENDLLNAIKEYGINTRT